MTTGQRQLLCNARDDLTLESFPCQIAGYSQDQATITASFPGFWHATWERVKEVVEGNGKFTIADVTLVSWRWRGSGDELPHAFRD